VKRISFAIVLCLCILLATGLIGCVSNNSTVFPEYKETENLELGCVELSYNGDTYRPYGVFDDDILKGKQIGIREGVHDSKIYEVIGYDSTEWIVEYLEVTMGGNILFKAVGVTDIPAELESTKQYDY
jgi:hypothetical protein